LGKYYHTRESVEEYIQMARGHDGRLHISSLEEFLPAGSRVLEIGSGPGNDWKILNKKYRVTGSDNSAEFIKHLHKACPTGDFLLVDAASLKVKDSFDGLYSNKVLHHLKDQALEASVQRQYEILKPGGIICHTFWKGVDSELYNDLFINYHTIAGLRKLFGKFFETLQLKLYQEFEEDDSILFIGKKKKG
jgi:SAM-dependent methyltransferase